MSQNGTLSGKKGSPGRRKRVASTTPVPVGPVPKRIATSDTITPATSSPQNPRSSHSSPVVTVVTSSENRVYESQRPPKISPIPSLLQKEMMMSSKWKTIARPWEQHGMSRGLTNDKRKEMLAKSSKS